MISIIDYKAGNLTSVLRAITYLGYEALITADPETILSSERIIFPGVGAAGAAMNRLKETGIDQVLKEYFHKGNPFLGICLGSQIIFEESEEDNGTECLGLLSGKVKRFTPDLKDDDGSTIKIPHMGWNKIKLLSEHPILKDIPQEAEYYFVHSYYPAPSKEELILGTTKYGIDFASAVFCNNLVAFQFHPEKSGRPGLKILDNFCIWNP